MNLAPLRENVLPKPLPLKKLIGPSFILLGLGLGSGELILWPYLSSNFGMGIIWAAVLGITFQFFLNMEIARYTLATGESIFVGLTRKMGIAAPIWFIISTLVPWMWPGIIAASATVLASVLGFDKPIAIAIPLLILIGTILSAGHIVYKTQERFQKTVILLGVPFVLVLTFIVSSQSDWIETGKGLVGIGKDFFLLPASIPLATFLGALAYAGAGGNLNLSQSLYVKEKGYGMSAYSGRLTSILWGKKENVSLTGSTFSPTKAQVAYFKKWWKNINLEHLIVFWGTGAFTMILLSTLAYSTVFGQSDLSAGINFVIAEGKAISENIHIVLGVTFLTLTGLMLFGTQFSVFASTSRIMSENLMLVSQKRFPIKNVSRYFYFFLWLQIISGIIIFLIGFTEPLALVVTGAVLNAFSMFVYSALVLWLNRTNLNPQTRPGIARSIIIIGACLFYGGFSIFTIYQHFFA